MDPLVNYERCLALNPRVGAAIRGAVAACHRAPVRSVICWGSIPLGGFIPRHSDINLLVATDDPPVGGGWAALMAELGAPSLSAVLVEAKALRARDPKAVQGLEPLRECTLHAMDLILLRKYSVVVDGDDVRPSIPELDEKAEIGAIIGHVREVMVPRELLKLRSADAVALGATDIVNVANVMIRCLYTLRNGTLVAKPDALKWAIREFGPRKDCAALTDLCRTLLGRMTSGGPDQARDREIPVLFRDAVPAWQAAVAS